MGNVISAPLFGGECYDRALEAAAVRPVLIRSSQVKRPFGIRERNMKDDPQTSVSRLGDILAPNL